MEITLELAASLSNVLNQYKDDLKYPPVADSKERRVARINSVLSELNAVMMLHIKSIQAGG